MPESSSLPSLLRTQATRQRLGLEEYKLTEMRPCLHYLALGMGKNRSYRFSAPYINALLNYQMQQPTAMVFSVLADNFAQTEAARKLVIDTEQAHEKAVQENVLTLPDGLRVIGSASIASLLDTTPQTVNNWIERHESVEPYELPQVFDKYAPNKPLIHEEDFRKIYRWFVPALVPNPPLSYGQLPENNPTQQMGQDYF